MPKRETLLKETVAEHQQALDRYFNGYETRHGQAELTHITIAAQQLADVPRQLPESAKPPVLALLSR